MHTALITGGTSGIGAAFAQAFATRGVNLVLVARDGDRLAGFAARLRSRYGVVVETLQADLTDREEQQRVARRIEEGGAAGDGGEASSAGPDAAGVAGTAGAAEAGTADGVNGAPGAAGAGPIDILVNNAGFSVRTDLLSSDMDQHDRGLDVMQRAVLVLGAAAARTFAARNKAAGRGRAGQAGSAAGVGPSGAGRAGQRTGRSGQRASGWIINVCSVSSLITQNNYTAIKAWTLNYSESLSVQTAGTGVQVTALVPGWVRTEFHERAGIKGSSIPGILWIEPDKLVEYCLRDVARGKSVSVPQLRWKLITTGLRMAPRPLIHSVSALLSSRRKKEG